MRQRRTSVLLCLLLGGVGVATAADASAAPLLVDAGGPYTVTEGESLTLDGSRSTPGGTYAWDLDADGSFDDATGLSPTLTWADLEALGIDDGPGTASVTLQRTDGRVPQTSQPVALDVVNGPPVAVITGSLTATVGVPFTLKVGADDPSAADMAAMFTYTLDWGDGTRLQVVVGPADPPVTHTYLVTGQFNATFTATDKDNFRGVETVGRGRDGRSRTIDHSRGSCARTDRSEALSATGADIDPLGVGLAVGLVLTGLGLLHLGVADALRATARPFAL